MKQTILMVAILVIVITSKLFAQDSASSSLQDVITSYLDVKNALIKDNGDSVRAAAKILYETIASVSMDKLSPSEHKVWMAYQEKLSYDAEHMKGTNEIEHQREHFSKLSVNFYKMVNMLNINTTDLYYQFCPMANAGKGAYWVSEQEGILNPYFGKRMLKCGSTKETIKGIQ